MNEQDFQMIEEHLGFLIPGYYRETLSNYPFVKGSFAEEFLLPDEAELLIDMNDPEIKPPGVEGVFFIGGDGGDEMAFVDASKEDSGVSIFELETGACRSLTPDWASYLEYIHRELAETVADEEAMEQNRYSKRWWEFWK